MQLKLKPEQKKAIETVKRDASRRPWTNGSAPFWGTQVRDALSLKSTCKVLKINFVKLVMKMYREHNRTINVLIEGCGMSSVGEELIQRAEKEGIAVNVVKTDIYSLEKFRQLAQAEAGKGRNIETANYHQLTPEEIHTMGENRFHLVLSRSGGLTYTKLPKLYGLKNIWRVLHPEGEAHILTEQVYFRVSGEEGQESSISGSAIKLREYNGTNTPEGEFLEKTEGLHYEEDGDGNPHRLRIKKQKAFEDFFPPDNVDFVPSFNKAETREEFEAHRTIFDFMDEPPIEMPIEEFESLKGNARTMEMDSLGQLGRPGGVNRRNFGKNNMDLVLRYGRYFIVAIDEFGLNDKILWSEKPKE
jgi:hypothetical protein